MKRKVLFVSGENCPACKNVKVVLQNAGLLDAVEYIDSATQRGTEVISEYGIRGIPTLLRLREGPKGAWIVADALVGDRHTPDKIKSFVEAV